MLFSYVFPLTQPFNPNEPILVLPFNFVYCKFESKLPFNKTEDKWPHLESMFHKLPLYFTLVTDLEAVCLLVNLPLASNLKPVNFLYLRSKIKYLIKYYYILLNY